MKKKFNELGVIASTYEQLQGIVDLRIAFEDTNCSISSRDEQLVRTLLQCMELLYLNISELSDRQRKAFKKLDLASSLQHSIWHSALLNLGVKIINYATSICRSLKANTFPFNSPSGEIYLNSYEELSEAMLIIIEDQSEQMKRAIPFGSLNDPLAFIMHNMKKIYQYNEIILDRYNSFIRIHYNGKMAAHSYLCFESLRRAFHNPRIKGDTYFSQFRLLHQIPELVGMYCIDIVDDLRVIQEHICFKKLTNLLRRLIDLLQIINCCSEPLLSYLIPSEYHKIRENLGKTSGSHSKTLETLLRRDYTWLTDIITNFIASSALSAAEERELTQNLELLHQEVLCWRDMHLGLPRNVLGGFRTKSLIGSPDAVSAAYDMRQSSLPNKLNLSKPDLIPGRTSSSYIKKLDNKLLKITAEETKRKFSYVQERSGPVFGVED